MLTHPLTSASSLCGLTGFKTKSPDSPLGSQATGVIITTAARGLCHLNINMIHFGGIFLKLQSLNYHFSQSDSLLETVYRYDALCLRSGIRSAGSTTTSCSKPLNKGHRCGGERLWLYSCILRRTFMS